MSMDLLFVIGENPGELVNVGAELNLSNSNAVAFATTLGYLPKREDMEDGWGLAPVPVVEFRDACHRYLTSDMAEYVDQGQPAFEVSRPGSITVVNCGRRQGYFTEKVLIALAMVEEAIAKGAERAYIV